MSLTVLLIISVYLGTVYWNEIKHGFKTRVQSKTIPYLSKNFVGREDELRDLMARVDFGFTETRVISIVGSPGFGKSTLAIQLGHRLIDEGVYVHYVDMAAFPNENVQLVLAEKILESSNIMAKTITFDRLLRWARERDGYTLLILDNCDNVMQLQKAQLADIIFEIVQTSTNIKVVMTSREIALHIQYYFWYKVYELSPKAAITLLDQKLPYLNSSLKEKEEIAELTGNVPLALHIVGSILILPNPPKTTAVIEELRANPVLALSPKQLPAKLRINASISLSYHYLNDNLRKVAHFLALFPGSFDKMAALGVFREIHQILSLSFNGTLTRIMTLGTHELRELVDRSLIEYNERTERYQYHRLIQDFLLKGKGLAIIEVTKFTEGFRHFFLKLLHQNAVRFKYRYIDSLKYVDTERHNIYRLLQDLTQPAVLPRYSLLQIVESVTHAVDVGYLSCRFTVTELYTYLSVTEKYLYINVVKFQRRATSTSKIITDVMGNKWTRSEYYQRVYIQLLVTLSRLMAIKHGTKNALVFMKIRESTVKRLSAVAKKPTLKIHDHIKLSNHNLDPARSPESEPIMSSKTKYQQFYISLGNLYLAQGKHSEVIDCQLKIIEDVKKCEQRDYCTYREIGYMHKSIGNYIEALKFLKLSLDYDNNNFLIKMKTLVDIHNIVNQERLFHIFPDQQVITQLIDVCHEVKDMIAMQAHLISNWKDIISAITVVNLAGGNVDFLEEQLFSTISTLATEFQLQPKEALEFLLQVKGNGNNTKTVQWGSLLLKPFENYNNFSVPEQFAVLLIRFVISQAKLDSFQFNEALNEIEQIYDDLIALPDDQGLEEGIDSLQNTICFYLILRLKFIYPCYHKKILPIVSSQLKVHFIDFPLKAAYFTVVVPFPLHYKARSSWNNYMHVFNMSESLQTKDLNAIDSTPFPVQLFNAVVTVVGAEMEYIAQSILWSGYDMVFSHLHLSLVIDAVCLIINIITVWIRLLILEPFFFTFIGIALLLSSRILKKVETVFTQTLHNHASLSFKLRCIVTISDLMIICVKVLVMVLKTSSGYGFVWLDIYIHDFQNNFAGVHSFQRKPFNDKKVLCNYKAYNFLARFIENECIKSASSIKRFIFYNCAHFIFILHLLVLDASWRNYIVQFYGFYNIVYFIFVYIRCCKKTTS